MAETIPTSSNVEAEKTVDTLLSRVTSALADQEHEQVFTIGGKLDAVDSHVTLRWDAGSGDDAGNKHAGGKVTFPVPKDSEDFQRLLKDCEPATFGLGQRMFSMKPTAKLGRWTRLSFAPTSRLMSMPLLMQWSRRWPRADRWRDSEVGASRQSCTSST
jgi:hypothetical protein